MLTISYNVHDLSSSPSNVVSAREIALPKSVAQAVVCEGQHFSLIRSEWPTFMYLLAAESLQLVGGYCLHTFGSRLGNSAEMWELNLAQVETKLGSRCVYCSGHSRECFEIV